MALGIKWKSLYSEMYAILESGINLSLLFLYILVHAYHVICNAYYFGKKESAGNVTVIIKTILMYSYNFATTSYENNV